MVWEIRICPRQKLPQKPPCRRCPVRNGRICYTWPHACIQTSTGLCSTTWQVRPLASCESCHACLTGMASCHARSHPLALLWENEVPVTVARPLIMRNCAISAGLELPSCFAHPGPEECTVGMRLSHLSQLPSCCVDLSAAGCQAKDVKDFLRCVVARSASSAQPASTAALASQGTISSRIQPS